VPERSPNISPTVPAGCALAAQDEESGERDTLWRVWKFVYSPRWQRAASGADWLWWRGHEIGIIRDGTAGYRYVIGGSWSEEVFAIAIEAKEAVAKKVFSSLRNDRAWPIGTPAGKESA